MHFAENNSPLKVPVLQAATVENLRPGTLVRFRGMVQDMLDPEFYLGVYQEKDANGDAVWRTGKYTDTMGVSTSDLTTLSFATY